MTIDELLADPEALERGRKAVEDTLISFRDSRISTIGRGNGAVVCEPDGTPSHIIRMGIDDVLHIALTAIVARPAPAKETP